MDENRFSIGGVNLIAAPSTVCEGCYLQSVDCHALRNIGSRPPCTSAGRSDRSSVIFVPSTLATSEPAEAPAPQADTKLSNPKDVLGIRKAGLSAVPMNVVAEMGLGMMDGALKYGRFNFRVVGVRSSVYFDAAMRHLIAWWEGEDEDQDTCERDASGQAIPGTGVHHITKLLTCLAVLRDAQLQGKAEDDRPPRSVVFYPELNERAGKLIDLHADKSPRHYTITDEVPRG